MVPCFGCGRYFCRVCFPLKGAGQYCKRCHEDNLERLAGGENQGHTEPETTGGENSALKPDRRAAEAGGGPAGLPPAGRLSRITGSAAVRLGAAYRSASAGVERGVTGTGRGLAAAGVSVARAPGTAFRWIRGVAGRRFPLDLAERKALEGGISLSPVWHKALAFVLGGAAVWVLAVAVFHQRNPGFSIAVSIFIAGGVVWSIGTRFGVSVGIIAAMLALLALALGEVAAQLLFRAGLIRISDIERVSLYYLGDRGRFAGAFAVKVLLYRLIPSAVAALLVGWWPFPKRIHWRGFAGEGPRNAPKKQGGKG